MWSEKRLVFKGGPENRSGDVAAMMRALRLGKKKEKKKDLKISDDLKEFIETPEDIERQKLEELKRGLDQFGADLENFVVQLKGWAPKSKKSKIVRRKSLRKMASLKKKYDSLMRKYARKGVKPEAKALAGLNAVLEGVIETYSDKAGKTRSMELKGQAVGGKRKKAKKKGVKKRIKIAGTNLN